VIWAEILAYFWRYMPYWLLMLFTLKKSGWLVGVRFTISASVCWEDSVAVVCWIYSVLGGCFCIRVTVSGIYNCELCLQNLQFLAKTLNFNSMVISRSMNYV